MASIFTLPSSHFPRTVLLDNRLINVRTRKVLIKRLLYIDAPTYNTLSLKWTPSIGAISSTASAAHFGQDILEGNCTWSDMLPSTGEMEYNRVNCLVWMLHESARSFSLAIKELEFASIGPPVTMAWIGVDVHAWHKNVAYQVAVYALLIAVIEVEMFPPDQSKNNPSPVLNILSPKMNFLGDLIERQLNNRSPKLVEWFRMVELPHMAGSFMPLCKKWTREYDDSGVAGRITAITCCAAVRKLGLGRLSCPLVSNSIEDAILELMKTIHSLVSVDKLHHLATEAGFEEDFLSHFGQKILPNKNVEEVKFWIGLVQTKLCTAFHRESVTTGRHILSNKVQEKSLVALGLFAYLGRQTRLFLSRHYVTDLDKPIKDFISYLECGILFIYPEFSSLSKYQLLMEVIIDEIGWLDFYVAYNLHFSRERRRSEDEPTHAEMEIALRSVFTVCYDVISGFSHFSSSRQQALGADLLEFLLQSQGLLLTCVEGYWPAYDGTDFCSDQRKSRRKDSSVIKSTTSVTSSPLIMGKIEKHGEGSLHSQATDSSGFHDKICVDLSHSTASKMFIDQDFIRKSTLKLAAASLDVWMGTQLLYVDISDALRLLLKKLRGNGVTKRERRKMQRTAFDTATLIPVTILMLLPVSAVGHAAMFAAIKKYTPGLIPSPYSDERLGLAKQLKRTKKMKVQRICFGDVASKPF